MKIGIYDPYLNSLGGGERYTLTLAEFLSQKNEVEVFWDNRKLKDSIEKRLNLQMGKIKFVPNIFALGKNLLPKLKLTSQYDSIFILSDGSIPMIFAKKGILHFQVPFAHINGKTLSNKIKLTRFQYVVCNSYFTKKFIDKTYGVESLVIHPPVDIKNLKPQVKKNMILSVGRFTRTFPAKKQEVLIDAFGELSPKIKNWELILVGGVMPSENSYLEELKELAREAPIKVLPNISFDEVKKLYGQAKIYWHAAGFDENENENPEKMEHFGITTVEAMTSGCVPVVFSGGGLREIINPGRDGFLWESTEELKTQTLDLVKDEKKRKEVSLAAQKRSGDFSQEKFCEAFREIISH